MKSYENTFLKFDIINFNKSFLIEYIQISNDYIISKLSLQLKFQEIEKKIIDILDYIIISIYFLNVIILNDDKKNAEIIKIDIEFQVIKYLIYKYLIKYDILKIYKIIINKNIK